MSSFDDDFHQFLTLAILEEWEIRKIETPDGLVEDMGRNTVIPLDQDRIDYLQEHGYSLGSPGDYEFIAPATSSLLDCFIRKEQQPNIFSEDVEA